MVPFLVAGLRSRASRGKKTKMNRLALLLPLLLTCSRTPLGLRVPDSGSPEMGGVGGYVVLPPGSGGASENGGAGGGIGEANMGSGGILGAGGPVGGGGAPGSGGAVDTGGVVGTGGGTAVGQYVVSADGLTVTDTSTGLVWQRDGAGSRPSCLDSPNCTWAEAKTYCAGLTLDGSGWRLPTLTELQSIVDSTVTSPPTINQTAFPNTPDDGFWTSSPYVGLSGYAWCVYFFSVHSYNFVVVGSDNWVRCVR